MKLPFYPYSLTKRLFAKLVLCVCLVFPRFEIHAGLSFTHVFEKDEVKCITKYRITGRLPIRIKRTYQDGRTELLIIKKIRAKDASALYKLVRDSQAHLKRFMPLIVKDFGQSEEATRYNIEKRLSLSDLNGSLELGIFLKSHQKQPAQLIGQVGVHSHSYYKPGSVDGMYWIGASYQGKGIISIAIRALFDHLIATGVAKWVNLVMHQDNEASERIAIKLGMGKVNPETYKQWGYQEKREEVYIYSLSAEKWKDTYWSKPKTSFIRGKLAFLQENIYIIVVGMVVLASAIIIPIYKKKRFGR